MKLSTNEIYYEISRIIEVDELNRLLQLITELEQREYPESYPYVSEAITIFSDE